MTFIIKINLSVDKSSIKMMSFLCLGIFNVKIHTMDFRFIDCFNLKRFPVKKVICVLSNCPIHHQSITRVNRGLRT